MKTRLALEFADIQTILAAAEQEARANNWAVSIVVADDGGHPLGLLRLDAAAPITAYIATEKARTAALGRRESASYENIVKNGRTAFLSVPVLQAMIEGGVPILADGTVIGAVGVSGVKSPEDAQIARAGIAALGLA